MQITGGKLFQPEGTEREKASVVGTGSVCLEMGNWPLGFKAGGGGQGSKARDGQQGKHGLISHMLRLNTPIRVCILTKTEQEREQNEPHLCTWLYRLHQKLATWFAEHHSLT